MVPGGKNMTVYSFARANGIVASKEIANGNSFMVETSSVKCSLVVLVCL